ncbi:MAG: iron-sulfur-binding reductase [Chloroflexi bacterium HGW-Chloroflexi-1]|nr:MAG: iron-sulfur-binding reductase [Chloroflexi bacterium HGW-Chloroflexi-1]
METILCPPGVPCRLGWWNIPIPLRIVFFVTMAIAVGIMVYGIVQRVKLWRQGQPEAGFDRFWARLGRTLKYAVAQVKVLRQGYPAVMHLGIFWAMVILFFGTLLASLDTDVFEVIFDAKLLKGDFYLAYKLALDLAALFVLVGLGLAIYRRYIVKPDRLNTDWRFNLTLPLLAFIVITGLFVEALRLAVMQPPWAAWSVIGYPLSLPFRGIAEDTLRGIHRGLWIVHYLGAAGLFATLPWTNLFHIFTSPINIFLAPFRVRGALTPILNLEEAETLGVSKLTQLPWPRLVNVDACTECGRCQVVCPAYAAKQPLSPKRLVLDLRGALTAMGRQRMETDKRMTTAEAGGKKAGELSDHLVTVRYVASASPCHLVGDIIKHDTLWSCTTCYACVYECPVLIEQIDDIVDMRRYLALMEGDLPSSLASTLTNIERSGNPWKQPKRKRAAWTQGLDFEVPVMKNVDEEGVDVLWWVGCAGAYDPRNQKVSQAIARILHTAGVNYAILGEEETCTGDAARRAGNEYLFQTLAKANIETLSQYQFKLILTQCPHCYNTLLNEYPQFGGNYQVMHHTQYIEALLREENIKVRGGSVADRPQRNWKVRGGSVADRPQRNWKVREGQGWLGRRPATAEDYLSRSLLPGPLQRRIRGAAPHGPLDRHEVGGDGADEGQGDVLWRWGRPRLDRGRGGCPGQLQPSGPDPGDRRERGRRGLSILHDHAGGCPGGQGCRGSDRARCGRDRGGGVGDRVTG